VEDVFQAVKESGHHMPLDATEPRLVEVLTEKGPEDEMAVRLSHVPPRVRFGI
jgi:hypothetical protein